MSIESIKARLEAATPGPWHRAIYTNSRCGVDAKDDPVIEPSPYLGREDAEFIAHAPQDIAALSKLAESVRELYLHALSGEIKQILELQGRMFDVLLELENMK